MITLYVGNLPFEVSEEDVRQLFAPYGELAKVSLINDKETGRFRGFGFVEMDDEQALQAVDALDGSEFGGSILRVNESRDKGARPPRREW